MYGCDIVGTGVVGLVDGNVIDGNAVAEYYLSKLGSDALKGKSLHVIQVGDNPASNSYIKNKVKFSGKVGLNCVVHKYSMYDEMGLQLLINELNSMESVVGIILQLPLGDYVIGDEQADSLIGMVDMKKDVDGFIGGSGFTPCTVRGVLTLLKHFNINTDGANIAVLGRSAEVGRPLAERLSDKEWNATVTLCHSHTRNLADYTRNADIIISAIGKPQFITPDMIKEGAVCIDVGINSIPDATKKSGYRLVGDFDFEGCKEKASYITKTPGGTGPMTVLSLIQNCSDASSRCDYMHISKFYEKDVWL